MTSTTTGAILRAETLAKDPAAEAHGGAKAANLARLHAAGHRVPPFAALSTDACARVLAPAADAVAELLAGLDPDDPTALRTVSTRIRALVEGLPLPGDVAAELDAMIAELSTAASSTARDVRFAVRSSVRGEDSATDSFAGQLDTVLNVSATDLPVAIGTVLASAWSERALFYRARRGLDSAPIACAVVVQVLLDSAVSGVVFSCNPQTGDPSEAVVAAALGLGEGVVAGTVDCDTYFVDRGTRVITSRVVVDKHSRVTPSRGGAGTTVEDLGTPVTAASLSDPQILELADTAGELADRFGTPQDIEFAYTPDGRLHLLQARPVTVTGARETVFDNVNVAESYPGLSSPLTFSILRAAYEQVFRACHRDFGATARIVERNAADLYPYLVGTARGRIYYNISNWYRLFLEIPGMDFAIEGWEAALNIENRYRRPDAPARGIAQVRAIASRLRVVAIILRGWLRLPRRLRAFFTELAAATADLERRLNAETPERERDAEALLAWTERFFAELVPAYSVQIFNDFLAQQMFHVVGLQLGRAGLAEDAALTLRNELFCGEDGVDSVDPVRSALALTARVRTDPALRALFDGPATAREVWAALSDDRFADFRAACLRHIAEFGDRTVDELKLETDPLGEHPERLVPMLRNYLRGGQNADDMVAREQAIRRAAEGTAARLFARNPVQRIAFRLALRLAREHVKQRENMRLGRSRSFGLVKRVFREYGRQLHMAGLLDDPRDVFWLTYEEIAALTRGTAVDTDAARTVALRKADHDRWRTQRLPSRITTTGIAAAGIADPGLEEPGEGAVAGARVLHGIGCAPGRVEAPALVLRTPDPDVAIDGQVLVASTTDPGWVFLMVAAGGLVSERGSLLSHTAIIGRELGIPTVVGVPGITHLVGNGDVLVLDGRAGTVTLGQEQRS
ncbi:PEP-utilizing enzyme [Nocardia sp. NBC_00508]|uniref:PEP/pyruvate-binding domain-containing protein n=1 Tax=Nocardia sp. NBC_00508 TaxID=2975992 RepID=UPI002E8028E7|nr:PEP/pyruvate-binding domain-containing protein [Nocardia sp. NBC_00508]WUD66314.1 PEP-utilizing enzyme [Nocardia sp. NBC_00508]